MKDRLTYLKMQLKKLPLKKNCPNNWGIYTKPSNPAESLFVSEKGNFVNAYKKNIIDVYEHIVRIKCITESEFLNQKITDLKEILIKIYDYEIGLLLKGYRDELDEIMTIKELDVKVLNWIKHK